jgi:tetratricopeptide (TPR) repeat protein
MGATLGPQCPNENDLLAFYERVLSGWKRARIEKHLGECQRCRESIATLVSFGRPSNQFEGDESGPIGKEAIGVQLSKIVAMAGEDEDRLRRTQRLDSSKRVIARRAGAGLALPLSNRLVLATAALVVILLAIPVVFWIQSRPSPTQQAMQALNIAISPGRNAETVISGLRYSPNVILRGDTPHDDLLFERALSKVAYAKSPEAPIEARHALARIWLARNAGNDPQNALAILSDIDRRQPGSAAIQNDIGVAQFELNRFGEASASFNRALTLSPGFREALFNRAVAQKANVQYAEAIGSFEEFIRTNPDGDWRNEAEQNVVALRSLLPSSD